MIQTSKKNVLAVILVFISLFNIFAMPALASGTETSPLETVAIELLSDEGAVVATFSSQMEFEIYMAGPSLMYESCGTGLYQHGQYTYTKESTVVFTTDDGFGNVTIIYMIYVQVYCSSCNALMETYYVKA